MSTTLPLRRASSQTGDQLNQFVPMLLALQDLASPRGRCQLYQGGWLHSAPRLAHLPSPARAHSIHRLWPPMFVFKRAKSGAAASQTDVNVLFYRNEMESRPSGALIDDLHRNWRGEFERLEMHHGYIQWLFPVFENAG